MEYNSTTALSAPAGYHRMANGILMPGEYHINTFAYTSGGEFTEDGNDYIGYYNISDKMVFKGRLRDSESIELAKADNISGNFILEKSYFNRGTSVNISLLNPLSSILFEPSEILNQNTINSKLDLLYSNFLDLYNACFIRDNNIPKNYSSYIAVTAQSQEAGATPHISNVTNISTNFVSGSAFGFNDVKGFDVIGMRINSSEPLKVDTPDAHLLTYFTTSAINILRVDNTASPASTVTFVMSTDKADGLFSQSFQNITDITTNNRDTLYVSDSFHNQIYRLYIDPILNESRIDQTNFDLINAGGIKLNTAGTNYLSGANLIYYYNDEIYTWNEGRKTIIVLKDNLSKVRELNHSSFKTKAVADFAVNPLDGVLYILFTDFSILEIDSLFTAQSKVIAPSNQLKTGETPKRILFSQNDSNIYYIVTDNNVYKYFIFPAADDFVGSFRWSNAAGSTLAGIGKSPGSFSVAFSGTSAPTRLIADAKILSENSDRDSLFLLDSAEEGRIRFLRFNENNNLVNNLTNSKFKIFDKNDINLKEEYFNNLTINKSFKKLLFNLDNLAANINSAFLFEFDNYNMLTYQGNASLSANIQQEKEVGNFLGVNEVVTPQVFNRCLEKIFNYQNNILGILTKRIQGKKFPDNEVVMF